MAIAFEQIPSGTLVPFEYFEASAAPAPYEDNLKLLLIGHRNNALGSGYGTARYDVPYVLSQDTAFGLFGKGSMLDAMYRVARQNFPGIEIWGIAPPPDNAGLPCTATIHVVTPPNVNGNLSFHIAAQTVQIAARTTDTVSQIAARLTAQINKQKSLPCRAYQDGTDDSYINLVCNWKGISGRSILIDFLNYGQSASSLANYCLNATAFSGGAGNANISNALTALGDQQFDVLCLGHDVTTSQLDYLEDFLDGTSGRWSPSKQLYGHAICCRMDTYANLVALGITRNDPHTSIVGVEGSRTPPWEWSAAVAAQVTGHLNSPPEMSRPLQAIELKGVVPSPTMSDWFSQDERQALLNAGIAVHRIDRFRKVWLDRCVTTYQANEWGDADSTWRDIETLFQTSYFIRYLRQRISNEYPRAALTDKPTGIPGFVSPGELYETVIKVYYELQAVGLVENADLFARVLVVERDAVEANRVNMLVPIDVVNQFRILAARVETNLQLRDATQFIV